MVNRFKDFYGNHLENGIYFAGDGEDGDLYSIKLSSDQQSFSANYRLGTMPIKNLELFAKQLIRLDKPRDNLRFALARLPSE